VPLGKRAETPSVPDTQEKPREQQQQYGYKVSPAPAVNHPSCQDKKDIQQMKNKKEVISEV
jgi:hypothetical protein